MALALAMAMAMALAMALAPVQEKVVTTAIPALSLPKTRRCTHGAS